MEGIFGTMKNKIFYERDYTNATLNELKAKMDGYIVWHNEKRQKRSLGSMSSLQYRCSLGLVA